MQDITNPLKSLLETKIRSQQAQNTKLATMSDHNAYYWS